MQTETQKNWNEYFGNDIKKQNNRKKPKMPILYLMMLIIIVFQYMNLPYFHIDNIIGSSFNGVKMATMVHSINKRVIKNNEYINKVAQSKGNDDALISEWKAFITQSSNYVNGLKYHKSYVKYINASKNLFYDSNNLIDLITGEKGTEEINKQIQKINKDTDQIREELIMAFKNNGIGYIEKDGTITFSYKLE